MIKYFTATEECEVKPQSPSSGRVSRGCGSSLRCICPAQMAVPCSALSRDREFHSGAISFSTVWTDRRGLLKISYLLLGTQQMFVACVLHSRQQRRGPVLGLVLSSHVSKQGTLPPAHRLFLGSRMSLISHLLAEF